MQQVTIRTESLYWMIPRQTPGPAASITFIPDTSESITSTPGPDRSNNDTSASSAKNTPDGDLATSKIVRTAVAAGVIVLALTGIVLFFKISSWIRYHQRVRRQNALTTVLQREQRANAYEIAAWADEPGLAPVKSGLGEKSRRKKMKEGMRMQKRGGANAYAVYEWEGVAQ